MYKGIIIEQSLEDTTLLRETKILNTKISDNLGWVLHTVILEEDKIQKFANIIKDEWYMHFWKDRKVIVVFKNKIFHIDYDDKSTWKEAIQYGIFHGIAKEELDFPIEEQ